MKQLVFALFVIPIAAIGQNYQLFENGRDQVFANESGTVNAYSIAFDSVRVNNGDTIFYNFLNFNPEDYTSVICPAWGANYRHNKPSWIGRAITRKASGIYEFVTVGSDTIRFDVDLLPLDTLIMFESAVDRLSTVSLGTDTLTILGQLDSVRTFLLRHTTLAGTPIPASLHNETIVVSRFHGLVRFFHVADFPTTQLPVSLIGQTNPDLGLYRVTDGMLYDHQLGDVYQTYYYSHQYGGPPWNNSSSYQKTKILSRTETNDSLLYSVLNEFFNTATQQLTTGITTLGYERDRIVASIPFELFDGASHRIELVELCGMPFWSYNSYDQNSVIYCPEDTCWSDFDTNGPPPFVVTERVIGFGTYSHSSTISGPTGLSFGNFMGYFEKNGLQCGTEAILGISERTLPTFTVSPNPTDGIVIIRSGDHINSISVHDASGRTIMTIPINADRGVIDLGSLETGAYFLMANYTNGKSSTTKVLKRQ